MPGVINLNYVGNMQKDTPRQATTELTDREREILRLIATGTSNKDIARQLFISSNTVKVHLRNIFAKICVTSRTEAAVYAIHAGLSRAAESLVVKPATKEMIANPPVSLKTIRKPHFLWIAALVTVFLVGVLSFVFIKYRAPAKAVASPVSPSPTSPSRWQEHAPMPTARSGLAVAVYENKIYAIGGETAQGVTGVAEQYDVATDSWITLLSKPVPVTDINVAVIGGQIYIPGGRLASGGVTNVLESYDPSRKLWEKHTPLPVALSGYALVVFEGKLYVFGGWDGKKYLASVYEYEPDVDTWHTHTAMPTARGFASAAIAGGKIYVFGGYDGKEALVVNEEYLPTGDTWSLRAPLPAGRYAMGVASIVDIIYAIGGAGDPDSPLPSLQYSYQKDQWQAFADPFPQQWSYLGLISLQTQLYGIGGWWNDAPTAQNLSYQAIYTIMIPIIAP